MFVQSTDIDIMKGNKLISKYCVKVCDVDGFKYNNRSILY